MKRTPKIALLSGVLALAFCSPGSVLAQAKKAAPKAGAAKPAAAKGKKMSDGFAMLPSGLEHRIVKHGTGTRKPAINDHIEMHIHLHIGDSIIFDSRKMNNNLPVPLTISAPKYKGDPMEGFMMAVVGDSAIFRLPVDSLKAAGIPLQPWMKEGTKIEYNVVLVSVRSEEEEKKFNDEQAAKQKGVDEKILQEYFTNHNIKPMRTSTGLYYTISDEGAGPVVKPGQKVNVNYTGKFMNGTKFDSNTDSNFHHVQPFELEVGRGKVIKGWDEGLLLLKKASKATFYIPSTLAYGSQEQRGIPGNSILIFDLEVVDVQDPPPPPARVDPAVQAATDDKILQDYFAKNNIKATKTASGLYYVIGTQGLGPTAKPGKKITMNYTGKFLDGTPFDSNTDPKFNHVSPFNFTLGQGQVIKGWDEGVQLLKIGSRATLFIPSALAYGPAAMRQIPANSILVFDLELVGIDN
jgi:FKBP-type peptidyl-prolyl cis-trans isomerase FkpA